MIHQAITRSEPHPFCPHCGYNMGRDEDLTLGSLTVGLLTGCTWKGCRVRLSAQQLYALHTIASAKGRLVRHATIQDRCDCTYEHVKVVVCWIKRAFRKVDPTFNQITNEWGMGYKWRVVE